MESPRPKDSAHTVATAGRRRARQRAGHGRRGHGQNPHARRALPGLPLPGARVARRNPGRHLHRSRRHRNEAAPAHCAGSRTLDARRSTLDQHLAEQLALFDTAHIGTLHSFCLRLVREHFYELGLDPQLAVLDTGEARLLAEETLDEQLQVALRRADGFFRRRAKPHSDLRRRR